MAITISGSGITSANIADGTITTDDILASDVNSLKSGRKNLIINGDMKIDQRNAGASHTGSGFVYSTDRWWSYYAAASGGTITRQQVTDTPEGFDKSLKWTVGTADTAIAADDQYIINHTIEAQNMSQIGLGTSWAKPFTVSFWVKSSVTGQYGVMVGSPNGNTLYTTTVTIDSADTWEYKTVTIQGTSIGAWNTDNSSGLYVRITLAAGTDFQSNFETWTTGTYKLTSSSQANWMATAGNTFQMTGVQLELGSVATDFEHRSYGEELALCQRYYEILWDSTKHVNTAYLFKCNGTNSSIATYMFQVEKRAASTITYTGFPTMYPGGVVTAFSADSSGTKGGRFMMTPTTSVINQEVGHMDIGSSTAAADAEL